MNDCKLAELIRSGTQAIGSVVVGTVLAVSWGRDRALGEIIVAKCSIIHSLITECSGAIDFARRAHAYWGRGSPLEDWTKLYYKLMPRKGNSKVMWAM